MPAIGRRLSELLARPALRATVLGCASLLITALPLAAQIAPGVGGRVTSGVHGAPLAGALVTVIGSERRTLTDSIGGFHLEGLAPGEHMVEVSFIGHQTLQHPVRLTGADAVRIDLELPVEAVPLRGVEVEGRGRMSAGMVGFHERRERATGFFFTADDIAAMQARLVTDLLRRVPGATVQSIEGPYGRSQVVRMGRALGAAGARECSAVYYMDGIPFPVSADVGINTYVSIRDIEGVEVYSGTSRIPSRFNTGQMNTRCGVIAIWTRTGPER